MKSANIRQSFLDFFAQRGHKVMPSSPLVLPWDPTVLFTTAGMQQFKPYFEGRRQPPARRLTSVQKCFRTSDIDRVGDASHLTFFEMLGNFSIGLYGRSPVAAPGTITEDRPYFKAEAIAWAWEYVTKVLNVPPERLWTAVFLDDDEAFDLWRRQGVPAERIRRYGEEDNYWFAGPVGPCGPCSEIYFDFGPQYGCRQPDCEPVHDCGRFLEVWNLVFMTYYQHPDPSAGSGQAPSRTPLPAKNIDTGAGLERIAAVMLFLDGWKDKQPPSAYDTDLFQPIVHRLEELSGKRYGEDAATDRAMRIVADHTRAATFLIGDEQTPTVPSNEERGYAVRRIIRRAVYYGRRFLGLEEPFLMDVAQTVIGTMSATYPELKRQRKFVLDILTPEEERFEETLSRGLRVLELGVLPLREKIVALVRQATSKIEAYEPGAVDSPNLDWLTVATTALHDLKKQLNAITVGVSTGEKTIGDSPMERWARATEGVAFFSAASMWEDADHFMGWVNKVRRGEVPYGPKKAKSELGKLEAASRELTAFEVFFLHDTYGFPIELTGEIARERGFTIDEAGFETEMEKQRERSRAGRIVSLRGESKGKATVTARLTVVRGETRFVGYETLEHQAVLSAFFRDAAEVDDKVADLDSSTIEVLLAETPFYPEGGGQVGDRGEIVGPNGRVTVEDTQRVAERLIVHRGRVVEGRIAVGDAVVAQVDPQRRADVMRNHTGTHLLHAALRQVLGPHVRQSGSLVAPDRLRFDFTHPEAPTPEELAQVQALVNEKVRQNLPVRTRETSFDEAIAEGVLAFFGEAYGQEVRAVEVPENGGRFSAELCGGTHCRRTGDIGFLLIVDESSIGAGLRRIEALTGRGAEEYVRQQLAALDEAARRLGAPRETLGAKVDAILTEQDSLRKTIERLEQALARGGTAARRAVAKATVDGLSVSAEEVEATSERALRFMGDAAKKELEAGATVLGAIIDGKPMFLAVASPEAVQRGIRADALVKAVAQVAGGSGGGRPDMAQGGGKDPSKVTEALEKVPALAREMLAGT